MKTLKDRYLSTFTGKKFYPFNPHPDFGAERYFEDFGEQYISKGEHLFGFDPPTAESKFLHLYSR